MAALVHNLGLELPVFGADRPAITHLHHEVIKRMDEPIFVRNIYIDRSSHYEVSSLQELLSRTDAVLDQVAQHCGALVVTHTWGLQRSPYPMHPSDLVPNGFNVVAEVERVTQTAPLDNTTIDHLLGYGDSSLHWQGVDGYAWSDFKLTQFVIGTSISQQQPYLFLVDIEPMLVKAVYE